MQSLRAFLMRHRALALMLIVAALGMKIMVPTGYMIGADSKVLTVQICDDTQGNHAAKALIIPMKGGAAGSKQAKADCPFSTLSMASLGGADPVLLGLALAFILALGFAPTPRLPAKQPSHLRPPLRGPPALV